MGTLKYAILGLLNRNEMTGYELSKEFETTLFEFWNAKHSQIYPELKSLNAEGLIQYRVEITGNVLEKKVYTITDEGRRDFSEWEETLCPIQTASKDESRLRLFFLDGASPDFQQRFLADQLSQHQKHLEHLLETDDVDFGAGFARPFVKKNQKLTPELIESGITVYNRVKCNESVAGVAKKLAGLWE